MKLSITATRAVFLILFNCIIISLSSYGQSSGNAYVPQIGQEGKDVIWVPTPDELVNAMLKMAEVTADDYVIDLGSGDGRTVIAAAKIGARALGIEFNPDMVELSRKRIEEEGLSKKAEVLQKDLFEFDLSEATVITMFLLPDINMKLRPKLLDMKPGTRIVSNTFTMGEWVPDMEVTTEENWNSWNNAMMWIIPAKIEGKWKLPPGELVIRQEFQFFYGTFKSEKKTSTIIDGRLEGNTITFRIDGEKYTGKVSDNKTMTGTMILNSTRSDWVATRIE